MAEEGGDVDVTGDGEKKAKIPNTTRQLKGRLQKLIEKTDDECVPCFGCLDITDFLLAGVG